MNTVEKDYQKICELSKHARILQGISSILDWDQETYLPSGSAGIRSEQLETMAGIIHQEKTSRKFANALSKLIDLPSGKLKNKKILLNKLQHLENGGVTIFTTLLFLQSLSKNMPKSLLKPSSLGVLLKKITPFFNLLLTLIALFNLTVKKQSFWVIKIILMMP